MKKLFIIIILIIVSSSCKNDKTSKEVNTNVETYKETKAVKDTIKDILMVENPKPGQFIASPLEIRGKARGFWFFEAVATAELLDKNLQPLSKNNITAIGDWMTEYWVPFSGTMDFDKPSTDNGFLVLHKANASGLKEHDMSDTIPVNFRKKN